MNNVCLIGRLTADPVITEFEEDKVVAKFSLAVDKSISNEKKEEFAKKGIPTANFPRIQAWGKQARIIEQYLEKGKIVGVEGELITDSYEDKDNIIRYTTMINAKKIKLL